MLRTDFFTAIVPRMPSLTVTRSNILVEFYSFFIANVGSLDNADLFARQDFRIKFLGERGVDGGGLRKEFLVEGFH